MEDVMSGKALMAREVGRDPMTAFRHRLERVMQDMAVVHPNDQRHEMPPHRVYFETPVTGGNPLEEFLKLNADQIAAFLPPEFAVVERKQLDAVLKASIPVGHGDPKLFADMLVRDGFGRLLAVKHNERMDRSRS